MTPTVAEEEENGTSSSDASAAMSDDKQQEDVNNKHVLRQAQLSRELQELNAMLADKQELAGQMMRNDQQLESVKLQYEVSTLSVTLQGCLFRRQFSGPRGQCKWKQLMLFAQSKNKFCPVLPTSGGFLGFCPTQFKPRLPHVGKTWQPWALVRTDPRLGIGLWLGLVMGL